MVFAVEYVTTDSIATEWSVFGQQMLSAPSVRDVRKAVAIDHYGSGRRKYVKRIKLLTVEAFR